MDVVELLDKLELENKKTCVDSFQFYMAEIIEQLGLVIYRVHKELIQTPPDPVPIISAFFKHRNIADYLGSKIREFYPVSAFHGYADYAKINIGNTEFIYGHTLLAYICARLALRHHARGHGAKAAMYANEVMGCMNFLLYWLPKNDVYQEALARSALARNAAIKKHAKTYARREEIVAYWKEHVSPNISNEKAGEWLKDSFPDFSVRKLSEYVSQAKKEMKDLPPAGKA